MGKFWKRCRTLGQHTILTACVFFLLVLKVLGEFSHQEEVVAKRNRKAGTKVDHWRAAFRCLMEQHATGIQRFQSPLSVWSQISLTEVD